MTTTPCPRCGSTDPAVRLDVVFKAVGGVGVYACADDWHDPPTGKSYGLQHPPQDNVGATPVGELAGITLDRPTGADDPQHNDDDDVMDLTAPEAACFAQRLLANHLADKDETDQWAAWGLIPELSEGSYRLLLEHLAALAGQALGRADNLDRELGIDSRDLIRRAT